jgi:uncharacterized protein
MMVKPHISASPHIALPAGGVELLIIQPSPFCNIDCDYCYMPERTSHNRMSISVFKQAVERLIAAGLIGDRLSIVWHAGEPLAVPISFYEEAFDTLRSFLIPRERISHSIQSNGMLLNDRWCSFIIANNIRLGLSIDGPAFIHDAHRKTRSGKGTHAQVMKNVELLRKHGIDFHVIAVITEQSLDFADEVFQFFLDHGIQRVGFNIEELEGTHRTSSLANDSIHQRVVTFFRRIHKLQQQGNGAIQIREFDRAYKALALAPIDDKQKSAMRNDQVEPFAIISIAYDGSLSTFSPELLGMKSTEYGDFSFGNVRTDQIDQILSGNKLQRVLEDIKAGVSLCAKECEYFSFCGGGAPSNKYYENGSFASAETMFCRYTIKTPIDIVLEDLESSLGIAQQHSTKLHRSEMAWR